MKNRNKIIGFLGLCFAPIIGISQAIDSDALGYYSNANLFSKTYFGGSARMSAMAGAQTALGGDVSTMMKNPAGLGVYRSSEFSGSIGLKFNSTAATYYSPTETTVSKNNKDNFNIPSFGVVFAHSNDSDYGGDWKSEGFGMTFNRLANYNQRFSYEGRNDDNSFRDYLVDQYANNSVNDASFNNNKSNDLFSLAYDTYLLNKYDDKGLENDNMPFYSFGEGEPIKQEEEVSISGGMNQWDFGYGANYKDKLYLGAAVGLLSVRRDIARTYKETTINEAEVNSVEWNQFENTYGYGVNLKIGSIYKMNDIVRLGASIETPSYMRLSESYTTDVKVDFNNLSVNGSEEITKIPSESKGSTNKFVTDYSVRSPFKLNTGLALFAGKKGFISADAEYVFYNRARLSGDNFTFAADNKTIRNIYKTALNVRVGGEYAVDNVRLRAGYALYGNTIDPAVSNINDSRTFITGGIGFKFDNQSLDVSVVQSTYKNGMSPYQLSYGTQPIISNKNTDLSVNFTYGVRF